MECVIRQIKHTPDHKLMNVVLESRELLPHPGVPHFQLCVAQRWMLLGAAARASTLCWAALPAKLKDTFCCRPLCFAPCRAIRRLLGSRHHGLAA